MHFVVFNVDPINIQRIPNICVPLHDIHDACILQINHPQSVYVVSVALFPIRNLKTASRSAASASGCAAFLLGPQAA